MYPTAGVIVASNLELYWIVSTSLSIVQLVNVFCIFKVVLGNDFKSFPVRVYHTPSSNVTSTLFFPSSAFSCTPYTLIEVPSGVPLINELFATKLNSIILGLFVCIKQSL